MVSKKLMLSVAVVMLVAITVSQAETYVPEPSNRVKINLGATPWKFSKGDPTNAQTAAFKDTAWKTVGVPYTWDDTCTFLNEASGGPGSDLGSVVWYRKHFTLDNAYASRKIFVEFEGAHVGAQVYINGTFIKGNDTLNPQATHVNGFIPFVVDLTKYVQFGGADNVLAVKVSNVEGFYTYPHFAVEFKYGMGDGGLFRPVWMHICDKVYVPVNVYSVVNNWGTYVATVSATSASATVQILTHVQNDNSASQAVTLTTKVVDSADIVVLSTDQTQTIPADSSVVFNQTGDIANPHLWYPNNSIYGKPYLYKVYHIVKVGGVTTDVFQSPLGIRVITWNADFPVINGHPHYLWGGASRYDYPALGSAVPEEQQWRDAKLMADCGGNLWRPGHATHSPEFTAACDAYGIMLIQPSGDIEGSFMTSQIAPWNKNYCALLKRECHRDMIVRDRNNPSILAWEVSNGPIDPDFEKELRVNVDSVWDPVHTRAMSDRGYWNAVASAQAGYASIISCSLTGCEVPFHQQHTTIPSWGAEAWSGNSKGFRFDYDNELTIANEYIQNWKNSKKAKCFGLAQWYMAEAPGEDGIGRSFGCSMMDWSRIPKMMYKIYQACWTNYSVKPVVNLAYHWNRSGNVTVNAFSNCPSVRLRINNADQGTKTPYPDTASGTALMPTQCQWNVTWATGTLRAEGLDASGNVVCFDEKKTAGNPDHIVLTVADPIVKPSDGEVFRITANGSDAAFILATVVDAQGIWCPTASNNVNFSISGPGNYRGGADNNTSGNGGANYHSPGDPQLTAEGGMCKVAVRSLFTPGTVTVTATSPGLGQGTASFTAYPVPSIPVASVRRSLSPKASDMPTVFMRMTGGTLRYFLSRPATTVSFEILDAGGKVAERVRCFNQEEGWHPLQLAGGRDNGGVNGNGVYFVRCTIDGYRFAKRVVVMK